MGGRGAFIKSGMTGIAEEYREYSVVDYIDGIKVLTWNKGKNNRTIPYSNTPNTIYFSYSSTNNRIEKIYYYKDHRLVRSIDMKLGEPPHVHKWEVAGIEVGRIAHDPANVFKLNAQDRKLYEAALKWNKKHEE